MRFTIYMWLVVLSPIIGLCIVVPPPGELVAVVVLAAMFVLNVISQ